MNFLGNGLQLAAFIVLTVAILTGLMIIAATVAFLLHKSRSRLSGLPRSPEQPAAELMKEETLP
jgi:hypothetical protein